MEPKQGMDAEKPSAANCGLFPGSHRHPAKGVGLEPPSFCAVPPGNSAHFRARPHPCGLSGFQPPSLRKYTRRAPVGLQPPRRFRRAGRLSVFSAVGPWECNLLHTGFHPADTGGMPPGPSAVPFARLVIFFKRNSTTGKHGIPGLSFPTGPAPTAPPAKTGKPLVEFSGPRQGK